MTNVNPQNTTQKTQDRATRTPLKPGMNSCAPEGKSSCSTVDPPGCPSYKFSGKS